MRLRTPLAATAATLLVLGVATGCSSSSTTPEASSAAPSAAATPNGVEKESADDILTASRKAADAATSVKVAVVQSQNGTEIRTDLTLSADGSQGTLGQPEGQSVEIIATGDMYYVKGDSYSQAIGGAAAEQAAGKWISIPKDNPVSQSFTGLGSVKDFVGTTLATPDKLKKLPVKDINGVPAVGLESAQGTLWIATTGEPYPVQITAPEGQSGSLTMSDWNAPVSISAPPSDQVIDIATLQATASQAPPAPAPAPSAS